MTNLTDNYIHRSLYESLKKALSDKKVVLLSGPRRTGKTVLTEKLVKEYEHYMILNGENRSDRELLADKSFSEYKRIFAGQQIVLIDEAQKIPGIGQILKILHDQIQGLKIIATGSSSFYLHNETGEPLTGRKRSFHLFPVAQLELNPLENPAETYAFINERLIYGSYPELLFYDSYEDKQVYLEELVDSYLLRDILMFENIKNADKILDILKLLAWQIGKEVSLHEIGQQTGMSKNTVGRYIDLLKKSFVIVEIKAFSKNPRSEISKMSHYYFLDNGVKNAVLNQFQSMEMRNDQGQLWENYLVTERIKKKTYQNIRDSHFFWRTYSGQEIDWIEDSGTSVSAFEFKFKKKQVKVPPKWKTNYPNASFTVIHKDNYLEFIS